MAHTDNQSPQRPGEGVQLSFKDGTECKFTLAYAVSEHIDVTGLSLRVVTKNHGEHTFWLKAGDKMEGDLRDKRGQPQAR